MKLRPAIFVLVIFASLAHAQTAGEDQSHRKWLECDVDWLYSEEEVGPDFYLQISFRKEPVAGARIQLEHEGKIVATARTNPRGLAHFTSIPPSEYFPRAADGLAFPAGSYVIKVVAKHSPGEKIRVEWPSESLPVRTLSGRLTTSEHLDDPAAPLRDAKVELLDLRTGDLIDSVQTRVDGSYDFLETRPGLYAVRVTPAIQLHKDDPQIDVIAVELDPAAAEGTIPEMKLLQSECAGVQLFRKTNSGVWELQ